MAIVSITAANVTVDLTTGSPPKVENGTAGATITAGQVVYKDSSNLFQLSDANGAAALRVAYGIALNNASLNQALQVALAGTTVNIGGTVVAGTIYVLGDTAGAIHPAAELNTRWDKSVIRGGDNPRKNFLFFFFFLLL